MDVFIKYPEVFWPNIKKQNTPYNVKKTSIKKKNQQRSKYKTNF